MAETQPAQRVAIVGRNVASATLVRHLLRHPLPTQRKGRRLEWAWLQTPSDPASRRSGAYVLAFSEDPPSPQSQKAGRPFLFFEGDRRCPLPVFFEGRTAWPALNALAPALRSRILALGLFNDATPDPWKEIAENVLLPDPLWYSKRPRSLEKGLPSQLWIVPREDYIAGIEREAQEQGYFLPKENEVVLGLRGASRGSSLQLTQNAPFGFFEAERMIWSSRSQKPRHEGGRQAPGWGRSFARASYWEAYAGVIPMTAVAGLPPVSLWLLDDELSSPVRLLKGPLARVTLVPDRGMGPEGNPNPLRHLQIEFLRLESQPDDRPALPRPDAFLWKLCPRLRSESIAFRALEVDELVFNADPDSSFRLLERHVALFAPPMPLSPRLAEPSFDSLRRWVGE